MKKYILSITFAITANLFSQSYPKNWHLNYLPNDTIFGVNLINALKNIVQPANVKEIVVAVIDGGTDVNHEDLKNNIWINTKEIPNNSVDDDLNGYVDDVNGWDFIGGATMDVEFDNLELTRLLRDYKTKFGDKTKKEIRKEDRKEFAKFQELQKTHAKKLEEASNIFGYIKTIKKYTDALATEIENPDISTAQLTKYEPSKNEAKIGRNYILERCKTGEKPKEVFDEIADGFRQYYGMVNYNLNLSFDPRFIVGDDYLDNKKIGYGNNELMGPDGEHGTHVGGIIGAIRDNSLGMDGIATVVKIMVLRVVPDGDERDKDIANAIRYAVDNGAKIINMSFGKAYSFNKTIVDDAVKYAESKDVLLIHAAGNDNQNNDKSKNFPNAIYENGEKCKTWIEVGASDRDQNPATFSNYGKKSVDVFAPGVKIYSTLPSNKYKDNSGTSMASPVVAGVAALVWSYYPTLSAIEIKQALESSVNKPSKKVIMPGSKKKKIKFSKLCTKGGIVDVEAALKAAAAIKASK